MDSQQIIILLFAVLYFGFILYTRRKGNFEEFAVASRNLGAFLIFSSISASYIGPAMTMGLSRDGYNNGLFLYPIAIFSGFSLFFVALILAPIIRRKFANSYSIGDVFGGELSHNHKYVKIVVGIISFWLFTSISVAMSYAGGELINNVFGFSKSWSIAIITIVVIIYSFFGGVRATIQTDAFQLINFVILIPILAWLIFSHESFSMDDYLVQTSEITRRKLEGESFFALLGLTVFWYTNVGYDGLIISRILSSKSVSVARKSVFFAGIFMIFWIFIMVFIGSAGSYLHPNLADTDQILLEIASFHFHDIIYGFFIIAMLGVVMSTLDSTINSASVIISEDVIAGINPNITDQQKLRYAKIATIFIGLTAILIAGYLNSVLNAIIVIFSFYIPVMVPMFFFSVLKKKQHWPSALVGMFMGLCSYLVWDHLIDSEIPATIVGILFHVFSYLLTGKFMIEKKKKRSKN